MLGVCGKISERFWSFSDLNLNRLLQTKVKINLYQFNIETAKYLPEECDWTSVHVDDWKIIPEFQEVETWFTNIMLATYGGKSIDYAREDHSLRELITYMKTWAKLWFNWNRGDVIIVIKYWRSGNGGHDKQSGLIYW